MGYLERIDEYREEMIQDLQGLIAIPSVVGPAEGDMPFGSGVDKAFQYMLNLGKEEGFRTANVDNYGGHIEFGEEGNEKIMGILTHVDVVPEGKDWDYPPYEGKVVEGRIYGRGTIDDKGP
ncbi:MAG: M20/M25/M40 family metallo-hydrolase, partial [Eubacteriales bacterium]|nr:M20/M25/M40 family metallo-hydrolase [Eubacteriales bacterium]